MFDSNIEFTDEAQYGTKIPSIKEIVLIQVRRIAEIGSQELTEARIIKRPHKTSSGIVFTEEYKPDLREAFSNAVCILVHLIYPYATEKLKSLIETDDNNIYESMDKKLEAKQSLFREINTMFDETKFFDTQSGRRESSRKA